MTKTHYIATINGTQQSFEASVTICQLQETVEELKAECDALKSDAARWVYWRDYHGFSGYFDEGATASPESADIDAACDAAMKRVQP